MWAFVLNHIGTHIDQPVHNHLQYDVANAF
jgi:kynurenine formamidase